MATDVLMANQILFCCLRILETFKHKFSFTENDYYIRVFLFSAIFFYRWSRFVHGVLYCFRKEISFSLKKIK